MLPVACLNERQLLYLRKRWMRSLFGLIDLTCLKGEDEIEDEKVRGNK